MWIVIGLIKFTNNSFYIILYLYLVYYSFSNLDIYYSFSNLSNVNYSLDFPIEMPLVDSLNQSGGYDSDSSLDNLDTTLLSALPKRAPPSEYLSISVPLHYSQPDAPIEPVCHIIGNLLFTNYHYYINVYSVKTYLIILIVDQRGVGSGWIKI